MAQWRNDLIRRLTVQFGHCILEDASQSALLLNEGPVLCISELCQCLFIQVVPSVSGFELTDNGFDRSSDLRDALLQIVPVAIQNTKFIAGQQSLLAQLEALLVIGSEVVVERVNRPGFAAEVHFTRGIRRGCVYFVRADTLDKRHCQDDAERSQFAVVRSWFPHSSFSFMCIVVIWGMRTCFESNLPW